MLGMSCLKYIEPVAVSIAGHCRTLVSVLGRGQGEGAVALPGTAWDGVSFVHHWPGRKVQIQTWKRGLQGIQIPLVAMQSDVQTRHHAIQEGQGAAVCSSVEDPPEKQDSGQVSLCARVEA